MQRTKWNSSTRWAWPMLLGWLCGAGSHAVAQQMPYTPAAEPAATSASMVEEVPAPGQGSLWTHLKPGLQWSHWGYPEEFQKVPFGALVQAQLRAQVCNGLAMQLVLYRYDFHEESSPLAGQLNLYGRRRLAYLAGLMERYQAHPLVIESTGNVALDAERRQQVLAAFANQQLQIPAEWVLAADPAAIPMRGVEAAAIDKNFLARTKAADPKGGASGGGSQQMLQPNFNLGGQSGSGSGGAAGGTQ